MFLYAMLCVQALYIADLMGIYVPNLVHPFCVLCFNIWNFKSYSDMHLGHIQLITVFFSNLLIFSFADCICCLLGVNLCFSYHSVEMCNWQSTCATCDTLIIGLENGLERKKIIYVSCNGLEGYVIWRRYFSHIGNPND